MIINISTQHDNKLSKGSHAKIKFKFLHEITALINGISSPFCAKCACLQLFLLMGNQSLNSRSNFKKQESTIETGATNGTN